MKRRRAHDDIEGIFKRKLQKVTSHQAYSPLQTAQRDAREPSATFLGKVDASHVSLR
jgi:hypothetical protein